MAGHLRSAAGGAPANFRVFDSNPRRLREQGEMRRRMAMRLLNLLVLAGAAVVALSATWVLTPTDLLVSGQAAAVNAAPVTPGATMAQVGSPRGLQALPAASPARARAPPAPPFLRPPPCLGFSV